MAFGIPGITQSSKPATTLGADTISQFRRPDPDAPGTPSSLSPPSMAPDSVERSAAASDATYYADVLHRAGAGAQTIAVSATAAAVGATERIGPPLGQLGAKAASAAGSAARVALPIAGEMLGAGALVIATQSPAGESEADLAKTRALDAAGHQRLASIAHPDAARSHNTAFPGQHVDAGPNHTVLPAHVRASKDGVHATPAETHAKSAHTGHASPNLRELTKPTGTIVHQPSAANQATLVKQEKIVKPEHAAHLTPGGEMKNVNQAVIDQRKFTDYSLNSEHPRGSPKARVFKATLGYDQSNYGGLVDQIREGVKTHQPIPAEVDKHGARFTVDISVEGPNGSAVIRTGWIYDRGSEIPRLTTALVKKQ